MTFEVIPGAGHHSKGGAVIKPKVIEELTKRKLAFTEKNAGTLLVTIEGKAAPAEGGTIYDEYVHLVYHIRVLTSLLCLLRFRRTFWSGSRGSRGCECEEGRGAQGSFRRLLYCMLVEL